MKGPEPVKSEIWMLGSVSATRLGIMNGTLAPGLASVCSTRPYGSFSVMRMDFASGAARFATADMSFWPMLSRAAQRLSEATQSSAVTG